MSCIVLIVLFTNTLFSQINGSSFIINDQNLLDALISYGLDDNSNGQIDHDEVEGMPVLTLENKNISDLKGLESFPVLDQLFISGNNITTIDLTGFPALKDLDCSNNKITSINFGSLTSFNLLKCNNNLLQSLDLTLLGVLTTVECANNPNLTAICVSDLNAIQPFVSLDLYKKDISATWAYCGTTSVASLDTINVEIFPNPSATTITINGVFTSCEVVNSVGEVLYKGSEKSISIEKWSSGLYYLKILTPSGKIETKVFSKK